MDRRKLSQKLISILKNGVEIITSYGVLDSKIQMIEFAEFASRSPIGKSPIKQTKSPFKMTKSPLNRSKCSLQKSSIIKSITNSISKENLEVSLDYLSSSRVRKDNSALKSQEQRRLESRNKENVHFS